MLTISKDLLDVVFHPKSNFPFTPFRIMHTLDAQTQNALYKTHKSRIQGADTVEIGIPDFYDLETPVCIGDKQVSLRDMCFDLKTITGLNINVDVDNATRTDETVFQVKKVDKVE
jgi:hypothetical protein